MRNVGYNSKIRRLQQRSGSGQTKAGLDTADMIEGSEDSSFILKGISINAVVLNIIISAISGIAGTILGFIFGEVATKRREDKQKEEQKHTIRASLRLEMDQNLELLGKFWFEVKQVDKVAQDFDSEVLPKECYNGSRISDMEIRVITV